MTPWPGARTIVEGKALQLVRASVAQLEGLSTETREILTQATPGQLWPLERRVFVSCGTGILELHEVKPAGKKAMEAEAWLRGARLEGGTKLGE